MVVVTAKGWRPGRAAGAPGTTAALVVEEAAGTAPVWVAVVVCGVVVDVQRGDDQRDGQRSRWAVRDVSVYGGGGGGSGRDLVESQGNIYILAESLFRNARVP